MRHAGWLLASLFVLAGCGDGNDTNRAVGELASDRIELTAESVEPIAAILVTEGEPVLAGQALVEQDDRRARARLAEAEANLGQLQARLDELVRGPRAELVAAARANLADYETAVVDNRSAYEINEVDRFDIAFSIGVIHHLDDQPAAVRQMVTAGKPGGTAPVWAANAMGTAQPNAAPRMNCGIDTIRLTNG